MKASEILKEMPYLHPGEMTRHILHHDLSVAAIKRAYKILGHIGELTVFIDDHTSHVVVVDLSNEVRDGRVARLFRLEFKEKSNLNFANTFKNVVQVDKVAVMPSKGNKEIASTVYKMLVDAGFTVVSDATQFDPAKHLWKKIAHDTNYKMYVADVDRGIFKDTAGDDIVYNGTNISDSEIWTSGSDFNGSYRVLILTK